MADAIEMKVLKWMKGGHRFEIRYEVGKEKEAIDAAIEMVKNPNLDFDWHDAAHLTQPLKGHLTYLLEQKKKKYLN